MVPGRPLGSSLASSAFCRRRAAWPASLQSYRCRHVSVPPTGLDEMGLCSHTAKLHVAGMALTPASQDAGMSSPLSVASNLQPSKVSGPIAKQVKDQMWGVSLAPTPHVGLRNVATNGAPCA